MAVSVADSVSLASPTNTTRRLTSKRRTSGRRWSGRAPGRTEVHPASTAIASRSSRRYSWGAPGLRRVGDTSEGLPSGQQLIEERLACWNVVVRVAENVSLLRGLYF